MIKFGIDNPDYDLALDILDELLFDDELDCMEYQDEVWDKQSEFEKMVEEELFQSNGWVKGYDY